ncbi:FMN reductase, SsuE family [Thermobacillus composti KWC4]|jgi:FMN reductase|uniref:FMN reductase, SsuE family n=1 Tax=Thermobacillus composti (strain DSM 18247 / JCM 13945 / KWC4) TaxID=717605 RepID=L0EFV3_THECK|nr:NADPH-dependent FMN reductase [Thermobacillus composti]AGA58561.1 FMN reductase, SsuE family [Thermobacillus composti KWC4]REJ12673.1 MAG: FMN reductase (NADPH) [Paenibacillaceae bacterium]
MAKTVLILSGSPNPQSRLAGIISHLETTLAARGVDVDHLAAASLPAEDLIFGRFDSPAVQEANARVARADAVIVASPVYKASYTGLLKTFLDLLPQKGLEGKTVLPVMIGGTIAHLLAIEFALKPVLSALGARRFAGEVYALDTQVERKETPGGVIYELQDELRERLDAAAARLAGETADAAVRV